MSRYDGHEDDCDCAVCEDIHNRELQRKIVDAEWNKLLDDNAKLVQQVELLKKEYNELACLLVDAELITRSRCKEITGMSHGDIAKILVDSPIWKAGYAEGCKDTRRAIAQKLNGNVNDGITTAIHGAE